MKIFNFFIKEKVVEPVWSIAYHPELDRHYIRFNGSYLRYWPHLGAYHAENFDTDCVYGLTQEEAEKKIEDVIAHWGKERNIKITYYAPK